MKEKCINASPHILRATASGALIAGSVYNIAEQKSDVGFFFWCQIYASSIYLISNTYEAGKILFTEKEKERRNNTTPLSSATI